MRIHILIMIVVLFHSCAVNKCNDAHVLELREQRILALNFISNELEKEQYKNYENYTLVLIDEVIPNDVTIKAYQKSKEIARIMNKQNKSLNSNPCYTLDSLHISKLLDKKNNDVKWFRSDLVGTKMILMSQTERSNLIEQNSNANRKKLLLINLSMPVLLDKNSSLLSFHITQFYYIGGHINHETVLLKQQHEKWVEECTYFDEVYY